MIDILHREFVYLWYYFTLQFNQIFRYWVIGMVLGSAISVFAKDRIHGIFAGMKESKWGIFGIIPACLLCSMIGSMVSGMVLSRYVFADLPIEGGSSWARTLHMVCAYWGFVFMSLHLGLHWNMMMGMGKKLFRKPSKVHSWIARSIAFTIAAYGVYAFRVRQIGEYMLLKTPFVFFDFDEPLLFFFLDYLAVMGLFVCLGHYGSKLLKKHK